METCCGSLSSQNEPTRKRMVYWYILETFPRLGRAPTIDEMVWDLFLQRDQITCLLNELTTQDAIRIEPTSYMILNAYPYSGFPTRHRVYFDEGTSLYCMCAVDTFYVPFLTGKDLTIHSHCFYSRSEIEIRIEDLKIIEAKPSYAVVWNSAAPYDCPKTNFFLSKDHFLKWKDKATHEQGQLYTLSEALEAGKRAADLIKQSRIGLNDILLAKADEPTCYCREVSKATLVAAIARGVSSLEAIQEETTACTGRWCKETNPRKECCHTEIEALIEVYSDM
jgi:hypothetical protein